MNSEPLVFLTIVTKSYIAHARTLAYSLQKYHNAILYVAIIDDFAGYIDPAREPFNIVPLDAILPADHRDMLFYYTPMELVCALRPFLHKYISENTDARQWLYLDADILVVNSLGPVFEALQDTSILICPHISIPTSDPALIEEELWLLRLGVYNGGFLGLRRDAVSIAFIEWFGRRLQSYCFEGWRGLYADQLWLNLIPSVFPDTRSFRHAGANVAYWNISERSLGKDRSGHYTSNGQPLLFTHFSRWAIEKPGEWNKGRPLIGPDSPAVMSEIGELYKDLLIQNGFNECRTWPYTWGFFSNGLSIGRHMRRRYFRVKRKAKAPPRNPFEMGGYYHLRYPELRFLRKAAQFGISFFR